MVRAGGDDRVPLVTVGLPTYNRATYLRNAIVSVLAQDYPTIELLVSDNASGDETADVCREFGESSGIVYVRQETNVGAIANFQAVLSLARGEFFMWLGDDDELSENYVSSCMASLSADPSLVLAAGVAMHHRDGVTEFEEEPLLLLDPDPARRVADYYRRVYGNSVFYGVMRRDIAARENLRDAIGCDAIFVARMAFLGKVTTSRSSCIRRGVSAPNRGSDLKAFAHTLGLSQLSRKLPWVALAGTALADIGWKSPAYEGLVPWRRVRLALGAAGITLARASGWQAQRTVSRAGRAILRSAMPASRYDGLRHSYRRWRVGRVESEACPGTSPDP